MPETLLEDINPYGNIQAIVESDGRACFFYLYGAPDTDFGIRTVWVRNLQKAPETIDRPAMEGGRAPMNPRAFCRSPGGSAPLRTRELRVVWLPEGNSAALFEGQELLAIIPPWSGVDGFYGYARDALGEGPLAWPLDAENALIPRFEAAAAFWRAWSEGAPWPTIQQTLCGRIERALGHHTNYYAIDGGEWPPKALLRIPRGDSVALVTVGVSVVPQPQVELMAEEPRLLRRIELGAILPSSWPANAITQFAGYLSGQSKLPWTRYTWLGDGHTIPCNAWRSPEFSAAMLVRNHPAMPPIELGEVFGDPVSVHWFLPLTAGERDRAMKDGSSEVLAQVPATRWRAA